MSSRLKMARDEAESREKALGVFGGFEAPHLLLSQSCRLVGILGSIVEPFVLPVLYAWQKLAFSGSIALEFISDDHAWRVVEPFEKLPEEAFGCMCVPSALRPVYQARCRLDPRLATGNGSSH